LESTFNSIAVLFGFERFESDVGPNSQIFNSINDVSMYVATIDRLTPINHFASS